MHTLSSFQMVRTSSVPATARLIEMNSSKVKRLEMRSIGAQAKGGEEVMAYPPVARVVATGTTGSIKAVATHVM